MSQPTRHHRPAAAGLRAPVAIVSVDLAEELAEIVLPPSRSGDRYRSLLAVLYRSGQPLGVVTLDSPASGEVNPERLLAEAASQLDGRLLEPGPEGALAGSEPLARSPSVSVVVTTCAMGERAARCVASVLDCRPRAFEVIVVENRPGGSSTAALLAQRFPGETRLRYVEEPLPGLSRARNRGLADARGETVAFTDDDVVVDVRWIGAIAAALARSPGAACVTGPILPLELETDVQVAFEQFGRLGKGFQRRTYAARRPPAGDPLFPYAAGHFGSGANIALRADAARSIGGFDVSLGAGTAARGGEDLDLFIRVLRSGAEIVYEPGALLRHDHGSSRATLRRHAFDYGVGLSAMLAKQLISGGDRLGLLRRVPAGVRYLFDRRSAKNAAKGPRYPRGLDVLERFGIALGPLAYVASVRSVRRRGRRP